jgi:DNA-binding NtrC family response regulator
MAITEVVADRQHARILMVSSDATFRMRWIGDSQHDASNVEVAAGGADALAKLESANWGEVLLDRKLHDLDVDEVFRTIQLRHPHLLVRLVDSDQKVAVEPDGLAQTSHEEQEREVSSRRAEPLPGMVDTGPGLEEVFRLARLVGPRRTTVLITGETGTGKELVARGIHEISPRARGPFVVVNSAAIPEQLLEAELFGHARGAFTGAVQSRLGRLHAAHGGTLFLDEVGELPVSMQAKLLRFLQDGEVQRLGSSDVFRVDVRVISATNVNLLRCVQEGKFRQDLYYRLAVFALELPPLRQRKEQIIPLAELFLKTLFEDGGMPLKSLSPPAAAALRQQPWAGNVRELQHAVERAFILAENHPQLRLADFGFPEPASLLRKV